ISPADGWREFVIYRAAPQAGPVNVTFVLSGFGEAWIDDVSVQLVWRGGNIAASQPGWTNSPAGRWKGMWWPVFARGGACDFALAKFSPAVLRIQVSFPELSKDALPEGFSSAIPVSSIQ